MPAVLAWYEEVGDGSGSGMYEGRIVVVDFCSWQGEQTYEAKLQYCTRPSTTSSDNNLTNYDNNLTTRDN